MVTVSPRQEQPSGWALVEHLACTDGSAAHPWRRRIVEPATSLRDIGDAIHGLCLVHGRQPGIADEALRRAAEGDPSDWLLMCAEGFAVERSYLARLVAAAGPLPSTSGQAGSEAALAAQRHALAMLGGSDRRGCALGAVAALAVDWLAIRPVLDMAAARLGIAAAPEHLPGAAITAAALDGLEMGPARAMGFGAQQLLAQVRGFWDLMECRAAARG